MPGINFEKGCVELLITDQEISPQGEKKFNSEIKLLDVLVHHYKNVTYFRYILFTFIFLTLVKETISFRKVRTRDILFYWDIK